MATTKPTIVEQEQHDGPYGFEVTTAIIEHPKDGRLLLRQGYGGVDTPVGGAVRWQHGIAVQLLPNDTLAILHADAIVGTTVMQMACTANDPQRPVLTWPGYIVRSVARSAGLD
jgi:hypothetical protein